MIARFDGSRRQWSVSGLLLSAALTGAALAGAVKAQVQPAPQPAAAQTATEPKEQTTSESNAATAVRQEADHAEEPSATSPETNAPQQTPGAGTPVPAAEHAAGLSVTTEPPAGIGAPTPTDHSVPQLPVYGPGRGGLGTAVGGFGGGGAAPGPVGAMMARGGGSGGGPMPPSQPQFATIEDAAAVKADAKTVEKLQRPMPIQVQGDSFEEVLNMLAQKGGFDVLIDNRALGELNLVPQVQMNIREPQPIEQLLHFVLRQVGGDEVGFSVVHGVVLVSSKAELDRHVVTRVYDIRELGNPDDMQQTIEQTIGGNVGVRFINGKMIVTTSEPSHREVAKLLTLLRQDGPHVDATGAAPAPGQPTTVTGAGELTVYQLHHADAQDTAKTIQSKLARPGLSISSDARTNSVVIAGPKGEVEAAGALIRSIDGGSVKTEPSSDLTSPPAANR